LWLAAVLSVALLPAMLTAADGPNQDAAQVDLFEGMRNGDLAVKFIPRDSREGRLTIENKTKKPLSVKLPEAFAGVPVLAQMGAAAAPGGAGAKVGGGNQGMGGGMGGMGMGGMGGGGMFYIAPEEAKSLKVPMVCLEHGKAEPRPTTPYTIEPIESFTDRPAVKELCRMLGAGQINQRVAQAAAWYLNNDMTWQQLAAKQQRRAGGTTSPYFTPAEIRAAMQVATVAVQSAQARQPAAAPSTTAPAN
jgi:hypothetical protein